MNDNLDFRIPDYKIFDFHRHCISELNEFENNIKKFNIERFCLMPSIKEGDFNDLKGYITKIKPYYKVFKDKAFIFGFLDFTKSPQENLEMLSLLKRELNIKGIKLHPEQGFLIEKNFLKSYFKIITEIFGYKLPIYIHMDWPLLEEKRYAPNGKRKTFNKIASFFPDFKFIMGHAGGSGDYLNIWKSCKKYQNVFIETSMTPVTSTLSEVVWKVAPNRLLFGSNYPYCSVRVEVLKILSLYKVSEEDKHAILENNWKYVFND
ncbi:MAG: amidohydrolase family protein [Promethearchaeota archaeon]